MRNKLTIILFSLLLAVGWTTVAQAQSMTRAKVGVKAPLRADRAYTDMVTITAEKAKTMEYSWTDAEGSHISKATDVATKPEQIYELLRYVYTNKEFPGPSYSAWNPKSSNMISLSSFDTRVDPVYYGGIGGGWDIGASYTAVPNNNITIQFSGSMVNFDYIELIGDGEVLQRWDYTNGTTMPTGWSISGTLRTSNNGFCYFYSGGSFTIRNTCFNGGNYRSVRVNVHACNDEYDSYYSNGDNISCAGRTQTPYMPSEIKELEGLTSTPSVKQALRDYGWTITGTETLAADGTYTPDEEGYTALVVSVKNDADIYDEPKSYLGSCSFYSKKELIDWIGKNIDQVKLLTDGLLIGVQGDYTRGTVFNCDGRYNKFFFLSKGQARKKADYVKNQISNGTWPGYVGEEVAFEQMFEEFSPTTGGDGDQITNFYSKMSEGNVYDIVHDCASVIQNGHQFSMSGNTGTEYYAMSGMNFFIPDYRLALWWNPDYTSNYVDGRDFVPYQYYSNGTWNSSTSNAGYWSAKYAQYNPKYAPKVGIYKITLDAEAEPVAYDYTPGNRNYKVTLTWISSLNEMSGHNVPQTYTVFYYDENGKRQRLVVEGYTNTDGETGLTTLVYYVEQKEHSYTIEYIVSGTPNDTEHPAFVAISNEDDVTIPGWDDFLVLKLDHHESDYIVRNNGTDKANWYRNFLWVDNDVFNGLSLTKVTSGMNSFNLYRWDNTDASEKKIAVLTFDNPNETQVHYTVSYSDNSTVAGLTEQKIYEPTGNANKYQRASMEIPDEGYVRVRGNGDLVIQPNGYHVNFKSITVKNGNSTIKTWKSTDTNAGNLSYYGWILSPGSKWEKYNTTGDYYLEGGGYIAIPNILNNSNYTNVTVEIVAYGDGSSVAKVAVNDSPQTLENNSTSPKTYKWNLSSRGPNRAGEVETITEDFEDQSMFPPFSTGGITADNHYGVFGDWKLYDSTGEIVWGFQYIDFTNEGNPHAWFVFNPTVAGDGIEALSGEQYLESICPEDQTIASDHWLISPLLSGNAQTITFYERAISTDYGVGYESYEVMASSTDNEVSSFTRVTNFNSTATSWTKRSVNLPAGTKYFAIHHYTTNVFGVLIDDVTYERPLGGVAPVIEGGMLRLGNLPIVDQLKEPIKDDNSHPDTYSYILRYEPNGPNGAGTKETGSVNVDIQKTEVKVNGNYTEQQIINDQNVDTALLKMDIVSADVTMDLRESDPYIYYYQMQGKANGDPGEKTDWLTQLQQMTSGKYMEMFKGSKGEPKFEDTCDPDIHHYYSSEITDGTYDDGDFFTYAPSVSTWGLKRRYFEVDGEDNTYGGPLWKTGAGKVEIDGKPVLERQVAKDGSVNPYTSWTETVDNGDGTTTTKLYEMYFLGLNAQGYLPKATVSNITYEPYMFRVFVESPSNSLRKYRKVAGQTGDHLVDDGPITGKYCVGSFDVNSHTWGDNLYFQKQIPGKNDANYGNWDANMKFVASRVDDLKIYVRFYYMVSGWNTRDGDGPARPGNGSESGGSSGDITTSVGEINVVSTVVDQIFFNPQGMQSDRPFEGLNIVVTRYSDGSTKTTKMIMK